MDTDKKSDQSPSTDTSDPQTVAVQPGAEEVQGPPAPEIEEKANVEPEAEAEAVAEPRPEPEAAKVPEPRSGGFGAALLGGVLAAVLGFVVARTEILDPLLPEAWRTVDTSGLIAPLQESLAAQSGRIDDLESQIAAIPQPDLAPLESGIAQQSARIDTLSGQVGGVEEAQAALESRLVALEKRPVTESVSPEAIAAYEAELARLRDAVSAQRSEVEALLDEARAHDQSAAEAARRAAAQSALARLRTALDSGVPYSSAAEDLTANGVDLPPTVANSAAEGVATMASLRAGFPPAARDALARARTGGADGLGSFLQRQLGARSVEPREGSDADAILSRAEAALTEGDLATALTEIDNLPETARPALAEWAASARRRHEAIEAAAALADTLAKE